MKFNYKHFTIGALLLASVACRKPLDEFLDKAPGVDITEDVVFSRRANAEAYVSSLYEYGMVSIFPNRNAAINSNPIKHAC